MFLSPHSQHACEWQNHAYSCPAKLSSLLCVSCQAARIWRKHAEAALRDPNLEARAAQNACYDDGTVLDAAQ
jgi:hypothetical protein